MDDAFPILDVDKSIVLYDQVSCDVPELWMAFDAGQSDQLFFQLGVPEIARLEGYRPSLAVVAPGIETSDTVPFAVPEGMGVRRFDTSDLSAEELGYFDEPFTDTQSWLLLEMTIPVPGDGGGYIVAWDPDAMTGKLWVAVGTVEDFSGGIDVGFAQIWSFHEKEGYEPDPTPVEQQCAAVPEGGEEAGGETDDEGDGSAGESEGTTGTADPSLEEGAQGCACGLTGGRPTGPLWLLLPALWRRRRMR